MLMTEVMEVIVSKLQEYAGAKKVVLLDPRLPLFAWRSDLPMVLITVVGGRRVGGLMPMPVEIRQVDNPLYPDEEPWPYNCQLVYADEHIVDLQVDVLADADVQFGQEGAVDTVARKAWEWFRGAGRYELKASNEARVVEIGEPSLAGDMPAESEEASLTHMRFDVALLVPGGFTVDVPTIESVHVQPTYLAAVLSQEEMGPEAEIELEPGHEVSVSSDEPDPALEYQDQ